MVDDRADRVEALKAGAAEQLLRQIHGVLRNGQLAVLGELLLAHALPLRGEVGDGDEGPLRLGPARAFRVFAAISGLGPSGLVFASFAGLSASVGLPPGLLGRA